MQQAINIPQLSAVKVNHKVVLGLIFVSSLLYLLTMTATQSTWINADHDGNNYVMGAKYLVLTHPTGAPLFNLINWVLIRLPLLETDYFRLALWSAVASAGTATLLFHMTKRILAPGIFLAAGVVVSQSTIVETYALITFVMLLAYYLRTKGHFRASYILLGLGLAIHHLPLWQAIIFLADDYLRKNSLKNFFWIFVALPFYAYIPLANREPYLWTNGESVRAYLDYFGAQSGLIMGLAVVPSANLLMRISDISILFITGFGAALPILFLATLSGFKKKQWVLPILVWTFALYYFTMVTGTAYIYILPTMAFGVLLIARYPIGGVVRAVVVIFLGFTMLWNLNHYDIGNNLDAELSATNFYEQVIQLPDNSVVYSGTRGWQRGAIWLYNYENNQTTRIVSVSALALNDEEKQNGLQSLKDGLSRNQLYRSVDTNAELKQAQLIPWHPTMDEMIDAVRLEKGED